MNVLRRLGLVLAVLAAGAFVAPASQAGAATCATRAGDIPVAVVVDFGTVAGSPGGVSTVCVPVTDRTNGAALLTARAQLLGVPAPRYDASGLLCSIDGYPETGCGEATPAGHKYWSYWLGGSSGWGYASIGPASHRVDSGVTEGWRFVEGADTPDASPPRGPSVSTAICKPTPSTTGGSISTGGSGSIDGSSGTSTSTGTTGTTGTTGGDSTGGTSGGQTADTTIDTNKVVTMPTLPTATTTTTAPPAATTTVPAGAKAGKVGSTEEARKKAAEPAQRIKDAAARKKAAGGGGGGGGSAVGPILIGVVLALFVVGGIWQARRRRAA